MKTFMKNFFICLTMILIIIFLLFAIDFVFISSYDANDEAISYKYCKLYSEENNIKYNELMNDFMYQGHKYYSCVLGNEIKLIYIFDEDGNYVIKKNLNKFNTVSESFKGKASIGFYQNQPVVVEKYLENNTLYLNYYDFNGEKLFDIHGLEKDVEEMVEGVTTPSDSEGEENGEKLVEE